MLALVPSALLLGVTQHLATDVVSAPLLWVVPLALYLVTFIAAFSTRGFGSARWWGTVAPLVALLVLVLSLAEVRYPILPITLAHLAAFTVLAMLCHTRLAESRPDASHLTGTSCASRSAACWAARRSPSSRPSCSRRFSSTPSRLPRPSSFALRASRRTTWRNRAGWRAGRRRCSSPDTGACPLQRAAILGSRRSRLQLAAVAHRDAEITQRLVRMSFAIPAVLLLFTPRTALLFAGTAAGLLVGAGLVRTGGEVLHRERTFFGVHEVTSIQNGDWHVLTHGTTTHGVQAFRGKVHILPTAYYHPSGPLGDVVFTLSPTDGSAMSVSSAWAPARSPRTPATACAWISSRSTRPSSASRRIPTYFTYLADASARPGTTVRTMAVDGRLGLRAMPEASYDLIVVDAFSSDAIPTHLITREAVAMFMSRLKPRGVIAFHVSSRFFNLSPVLARIADDRGLVCYMRTDRDVPPERAAEAMRPSIWVVLARDETRFRPACPRRRRDGLGCPATGVRLWTDDYTNVLGVLED